MRLFHEKSLPTELQEIQGKGPPEGRLQGGEVVNGQRRVAPWVTPRSICDSVPSEVPTNVDLAGFIPSRRK